MNHFVQRRIKCKALDAHPVQDAIVVSYSQDPPPVGSDHGSDCQKVGLDEAENLSVLASEIVRQSGDLIPQSHVDDVLSILNYLKRRHDVVSRTGARVDQLRPKTAGSDRLDQYLKSKNDNEKKQKRLRSSDFIFECVIGPEFWTDFKIESPSDNEKDCPSMDRVNEYVDMLYEGYDKKVKAASAVFRLCQQKENLAEIAVNETLLLVLVRVMREEGKKMVELATLVTAVFALLSQYSTFHPVIMKYKFGSQCLDQVQHEIRREESAFQELSQQQLQSRETSSSSEGRTPTTFPQPSQEHEHAYKKYQAMVRKQNHFLRTAFCLMLSLSSDEKVERKMLNRGVLPLLVKSLEREASADFFTVLQIFLTKLSIRAENKNQFADMNIVEKLYVILSSAISASSSSMSIDLIHWNLSLLLNLSFDLKLRTNMIQIGVLPKLLYLWSRDRLAAQPKTEKLMFQILYQMSRGVKVRGLFNFSFGLGQESLDMMMAKVTKAVDNQAAGHRHANIMDMMALMINLTLCQKNSLKISETAVHVSKLLDLVYASRRSAKEADLLSVLVLKLLRNVSFFAAGTATDKLAIKCFVQHVDRICEMTFEASILKKSLDEKIGEGRLCVEQDDLIETFVTDSLGLLSNLMNVTGIDWHALFQGHKVWEWAEERLDVSSGCCEDDLVLDVVQLLGTGAAQESCARLLLSSPSFLSTLMNLMQAKQEDDEIVLQIVFILCLVLEHESTKSTVAADPHVTEILIDLMQDKNPQIRSQCSQALTAIAEENPELGKKILMQKFRTHNSRWISMMQKQAIDDLEEEADLSGDEFGAFEEDEEDEGHETSDYNLFLKPDLLNSSLDSVSDSNLSTPVAWDMNEMFANDGCKSRASSRPVTGYKKRTRVSS